MNHLKELERCGQSPWLDYLRHSLITSGELQTLIDRDGLKGITSNPSIFEKAIGETDEYRAAFTRFLAERDHGVAEIYEHLAIADIRAAADLLRPLYDRTGGADGYVSLECSPYLANDTRATIGEATRLWAAVERPNLMVKVPATSAGIPAIRELIARGLNINITLLFSLDVYEQVVDAYMSGLEHRARTGGSIGGIASVASMFVSRIDVAVDKQLDALADPQAHELHGKAGIANAKLAYQRYKALFGSARWAPLAARSARPQRLLWASTSTKNPAYRPTMYVEALIGRDTVDTLPPSTLDAFRAEGRVGCDAIEEGIEEARRTLARLEELGVALGNVTTRLTEQGVRDFADAFDQLFATIARHRRELIRGQASLEVDPVPAQLAKAVDGELEAWRTEGRVRRLWAGDSALWTGGDEASWVGWLGVLEAELADVERLNAFENWVKQGAFKDVLLLGMGGSSLGPEVLALVYRPRAGFPRFHLLDSTDPAEIRAVERAIDVSRTLFIVSSKSGTTLEPNLFWAYFFERARAQLGDRTGAHFIAVTDPGSPLEQLAGAQRFAHVFHGVPSIGGRYSVLSNFGLVPAAAMGLDVEHLLAAALPMWRSCGRDVPPAENPGVRLGLAMGLAARQGRDKVTILASPRLAALGAWLEQLLAESTGKQGRGLIPVAGEPVASPDRYADDRFFAYLELEGDGDGAQRRAVEALARAGHPVARIRLKEPSELGQEFFRWEIATAVAGSVLGINPFDQPDVEASKAKARALTQAFEATHALPRDEPVLTANGVALYVDPRNLAELGRHATLAGYLKSHFERVRIGAEAHDYVALLAYIERNAAHTEALTTMRTRIRDTTRAATCLGFGPRFQHSTGQVYKGGPNSGVFLQITGADASDVDVPGRKLSFGVVKAAQARGDLEVLVERGRRAIRVHLEEVEQGLAELGRVLNDALA